MSENRGNNEDLTQLSDEEFRDRWQKAVDQYREDRGFRNDKSFERIIGELDRRDSIRVNEMRVKAGLDPVDQTVIDYSKKRGK